MLNQKFWYVYSPQSGPPTYRHYSRQSAVEEAGRLAALNPDILFYVLGAEAVVGAPKKYIVTELTEKYDEEPPF